MKKLYIKNKIVLGLEAARLEYKIRANMINMRSLVLKNNISSLQVTSNYQKDPKSLYSFITGFVDAEGCFMVMIRKNNKCLLGYSVHVVFQIELHKKDRAILESIQSTWGVGVLTEKKTRDVVTFTVSRLSDIKVVIAHFEKYPLITHKWADYQLLKRAFDIIESKEHLTMEGLKKLVAIKSSMNNGLSDELKKSFPNIIPVSRPLVLNEEIKDPYWLAGFASGEGCFYVNIKKSLRSRLGETVQLRFQITQHVRDKQLLENLGKYLECGKYSAGEGGWGNFLVTSFGNINSKIIPFFAQYQLQGVKSQDLEDFKKVARLMEEGAHLRSEGLEQIRQIKLGMNKSRKYN